MHTSNAEWSTETDSYQWSAEVPQQTGSTRRRLTHEAPEPQEEELGQRVEWDVAARALRVVVRAGELGASRVEAAARDGVGHGGHAHGGSGKHLSCA